MALRDEQKEQDRLKEDKLKLDRLNGLQDAAEHSELTNQIIQNE